MKKNQWIATILFVVCLFVFVGCPNPNGIEHKHTFAEEWSNDETNHWHASTCGHEDVSDKAAHTFGEWEVIKESTEEAEGSKERICTVCNYKEEEQIAKLEHTHKYAEEWSNDETNHWHAATCGHEDVKDFGEHSFVEVETIKEVSCTEDGIVKIKCSNCNFETSKIVLKSHSFGEWQEKDVTTLSRICDECNTVEEKVNIDVIKAANLPIVKINTVDNTAITSKKDWLSATMEISNAVDESWNFDDIEIEIRGRGNTTWSQPKKPYAIKLGKKQQICGMPKHKRWVLIANYLDNSFMKNEVAFYLSEQLGMDYTVRGEFVNLVLNDKYIGLYWLGEQIKVDENRVDIDEENDYLVEMDVYYDETWKFKSEIKNLPYMIKNDDDMTQEKLDSLMEDINALERALYGEEEINLEDYIDVDSFAKFYIVNEIMGNGELNHPKSSYFTFNSSTKILSAGPVWDFDWAGATEVGNLKIKNSIYYGKLFTYSDFCDRLEKLLALENLTVENVENKIEDMKSHISASVALDKVVWGVHKNPVGSQFNSFDEYVENMKLCVKTRLKFLKGYDF